MIPTWFSDGEPSRRTINDFLAISAEDRETALMWLNGQWTTASTIKRLELGFQAANDNLPMGVRDIIIFNEMVMMLYCWVECSRDDTLTKLTYVDGREYAPK